MFLTMQGGGGQVSYVPAMKKKTKTQMTEEWGQEDISRFLTPAPLCFFWIPDPFADKW